MTAPITVSGLGVRLGLDLTTDARAAQILEDVWANICAYTGRTFTKTEDDEVTVDVCCGKATLPNGPVLSVGSVEVDSEVVTYTWTSGRKIRGLLACGPVDVVYTWGYESEPGDVLAVGYQIAGRAYGTKPQESGTTSESLGGWSIGTGGAAASGPLGLMNAERETLDRYRTKTRGPITPDAWA